MEEKHVSFTKTIGEATTMEKVRSMSTDKKKWDQYRLAYEGALKCDYHHVSKFPVQLDIELNGTCNYRCESCTYRLEAGENKRQEISLETFKRIIDYGIQRGLYAIRLNYHNEPLLKNDIAEYISYAKRASILDVYLSTNGSLLDEKMSRQLIESGLDRLQISIDAVCETTYSKLRPGGNLSKVVNNVLKFLSLRSEIGEVLPTVRVNFVKQSENRNELEEFISFWDRAGVDSIGIQDCAEWASERPDSMYDNVDFQCNMPYKLMVIRYNGDVLPCCMFESTELVIGNIYKNDLEDLWTGSMIDDIRKCHSNKNDWRLNPICKKCVKSIVSV